MSETVDLFTVSGGRKNFVAINLPKDKLAVYSDLARAKYFPESGATWKASSKRIINSKQFELGDNMDEEYARTIVALIRKCDKANPAPITLDLFGDDLSFEQLVALYRLIGNGFKVPRYIHRDSVRTAVRDKIYKSEPFTFQHFKLVADQLAFDRGIFYSNMDRAAFLEQKDGLDETVKKQITAYCLSQEGIWDSLLGVVGAVQEKIKAAGEAKQARIKAEKTVLQRMQEKFKDDAAQNDGLSQAGSAQASGSKITGPTQSVIKPHGTQASAPKSNTPKSNTSKASAPKPSGSKTGGNSGKQPKTKTDPFVKRDEDFPPLG